MVASIAATRPIASFRDLGPSKGRPPICQPSGWSSSMSTHATSRLSPQSAPGTHCIFHATRRPAPAGSSMFDPAQEPAALASPRLLPTGDRRQPDQVRGEARGSARTRGVRAGADRRAEELRRRYSRGPKSRPMRRRRTGRAPAGIVALAVLIGAAVGFVVTNDRPTSAPALQQGRLPRRRTACSARQGRHLAGTLHAP